MLALVSLWLNPALGASAQGAESPGDLSIDTPAGHHAFSLRDLKAKIPAVAVSEEDPVYGRLMRFDAFPLGKILELAGASSAEGDEVVFTAADGYAPSVPLEKIRAHDAFLAFQENGLKTKWTKVRQGKKMLSPAPFYLIWGEGKKLPEEFPWPYQLVKVELVSFKAKYAKIYPSDKAPDSKEMKGFTTFKNNCIRCHSINLVGGVVGPELNTPKNITEYWDKSTLRAFIKNPGSFRARDVMPAFPQLTDDDLDYLLKYFKYVKERKAE